MPFPITGKHNKWPIGSMGDYTVSATDEYLYFDASTVHKDWRHLTVPAGKTLWLVSQDGTPIVVGVAGDLALHGNIRVCDYRRNSTWPLNTIKQTTLRDGRVISWSTPGTKTGGAGGAGGGTTGDFSGGPGGGQSAGFGGGGGGGAAFAFMDHSPGGAGGSQSNGSSGTGDSSGYTSPGAGGSSGYPAASGYVGYINGVVAQGGRGGGRDSTTTTAGSSESLSVSGGGGGAAQFYSSSYVGTHRGAGGGGGSGGSPGLNGAFVFLLVLGATTGTGSIRVDGSSGTAGWQGEVGSSVYQGTGGGGGGGGGGHGGRLQFRHNSTAQPLTVSASQGSGGAGGASAYGETNRGASGADGAAGAVGVVDVAHY